MVVLVSKSAVFMAKHVNDSKHTRYIERRIHYVRNGEKFKMHNIDWCEVGILLADITTNNVGEHDLTPRMKYIMVRLDNWDKSLVQEWWNNKGYYIEQEFFMTRLYWVEDSTKSVWNVCRKLKTVCSRRKQYFLNENSVEWKPCINR